MSELPEVVRATDGRELRLREIDPGDMLDLIEAAGSAVTGASASAWLSYAQMVCSVTAIDGVPVQMPLTKSEVKALARQVGTTGIAVLEPHFYGDEDATSDEANIAKN